MLKLRPTVFALITAVFTTAIGLAMVPSCGARWTPSGYHERWDLKGKHEGLPCESCHPVGEPLARVATECAACHEPDRPANHYEGDCVECHDEDGWEGAVPDHSFFPLVDRHAIACVECHGDFSKELDSTCGSCHEGERPTNHFPTLDCADCHTPTRWGDAHVNHDFFPLNNSHDQDCTTCHGTSGDFSGLDATCTSCHEGDRKSPDHHPGLDCGSCHVNTSWDDVVINHDFFPLTEAHDRECSDCHGFSGDYSGLSMACTSCHEPDRPSGHFAGECDRCHNTTRWEDASFDHSDYFPIPHRGVGTCSSCHPAGYETFVCTDCHEHRQSNTDEHHKEVRNYSYDSDACLRCHPKGRQ